MWKERKNEKQARKINQVRIKLLIFYKFIVALHETGNFFIPSLANRIQLIEWRTSVFPGQYFKYKYFILGRKTYRLNFSLHVIIKRVLVNLKIFLQRNSHLEKHFPKVCEKTKNDLDINSLVNSNPTKLLKNVLKVPLQWCVLRFLFPTQKCIQDFSKNLWET